VPATCPNGRAQAPTPAHERSAANLDWRRRLAAPLDHEDEEVAQIGVSSITLAYLRDHRDRVEELLSIAAGEPVEVEPGSLVFSGGRGSRRDVLDARAWRPDSTSCLNHLTVLLANALGPDVRVNALAPGLIDTPWTEGWEDIRAAVQQMAPLRRSGTPDDVADACLGLVDARYTTGQVVLVDGGMALR
jgi:hypothetical protein